MILQSTASDVLPNLQLRECFNHCCCLVESIMFPSFRKWLYLFTVNHLGNVVEFLIPLGEPFTDIPAAYLVSELIGRECLQPLLQSLKHANIETKRF